MGKEVAGEKLRWSMPEVCEIEVKATASNKDGYSTDQYSTAQNNLVGSVVSNGT